MKISLLEFAWCPEESRAYPPTAEENQSLTVHV